MNKPLVSVIMPVYNGEKSILERLWNPSMNREFRWNFW